VTGYALLIPEFLVLAAAFWALFAEVLPGHDRGAAWAGFVATSAGAVVAALLPLSASGPFAGHLAFDGPARFARVSVLVLSAVWLLWTAGRGSGRMREAVALSLFTTLGALFMSSATEIVTLVLAIELSTMPAYVLIGYRRDDVLGLEGALKYFLLSMLTSLVMLYGFSFVYGISGSTRFAEIDLTHAGTLGLIAVVLALIGMLAKLSAAPFHYWSPDAYAGAQPWTVSFISTVPKVAGAIATVRLLSVIAPGSMPMSTIIAVVAGASMLLGNLGALTQTDVRRMMAYSGVAHTGYLLVAAATLTNAGFLAAVLYSVAYSFPSLGIMLIAAEEGPALTDFNGLAARRPAIAWATVLMLLSLVGIPPLAGFFGKLFLFQSALTHGQAVLVVLAVIMSVVSAGYYLRIVRAMFFSEETEGHRGAVGNRIAGLAITACVVAVVAMGLAAGPLVSALGAFAN
jgi:NADH-quinone oxidoreductase subunit N